MDNKYYTPEIEEFCIGFEYEVAQIDSQWVIHDWKKTTFDVNDKLEPIIEYPHLNRVKLLDKEDIESLGYTQDPHKYYKDTFRKGCIYDKGSSSITLTKEGVYICLYSYPNTQKMSFKIKNKRELEVLLKQMSLIK